MTKDWANFWLDKNNNKDIKKTDFAKEEKKFNVFDLNTINWEQIKSGISKNALCNDNVLLESIFDSVDTDQHKGILSNKELELLKNKIENLAKDKKLGKKEANKLTDLYGNKIGYKAVFEFLNTLKEFQNENIIEKEIFMSDDGEIENIRYKNCNTEEIFPNGEKIITLIDGNKKTIKNEKGEILKEILKENNQEIVTEYKYGDDFQKTITKYPNSKYVEKLTEYTKNGIKITTIDSETGTNYEYKEYNFYTNKFRKFSKDKLDSFLKEDNKNDIDILLELDNNGINMITDSSLDERSKIKYANELLHKTSKISKDLGISTTSEISHEDKNIKDINSEYQTLLKRIKYHLETVNAKVDKDFTQGNKYGDCWLLAPIKALSLKEKGNKILDKSIKIDTSGNLNITLHGVNKNYIITPEEIKNFEGADGDGDVKAIEIAISKYAEESGGNIQTNIGEEIFESSLKSGGHTSAVYYLLTGKSGEIIETPINYQEIKNFNNLDKVYCANIIDSNNIKSVNFTNKNKNYTLETNHAYAIKSSDKNNVYLINPWDTSEIIPVPIKIFQENFNHISKLKLN